MRLLRAGAVSRQTLESFSKEAVLNVLRTHGEASGGPLSALREQQDELQRFLAAVQKDMLPLQETLKRIREDAAWHDAAEGFKSERTWMRAALGPAAELGLTGSIPSVDLSGGALAQARQILAEYQSRFHLPAIGETASLFATIQSVGPSSAMGSWQHYAREIQRAAEAMRTPWLDMQDKLQSVAGFAELQRIGLSLREHRPFDDDLSALLRGSLGDWRGAITLPENVIDDAWARTEFYAERGFDPRLTRFPREAFEQGTLLAGLRDTPPPFLDEYNGQAGEEDEDVGFERTNNAHDRLMRFEHQLRRFIDAAMTAAFGESWIKHRVPDEIRKKWQEKQQKARDHGEPAHPLIAHADFTDYLPIITRKDNWSQVFETMFRRRESVQESLQRLYPIRLCTMHARIITLDDQLYLFAETRRILLAIEEWQ